LKTLIETAGNWMKLWTLKEAAAAAAAALFTSTLLHRAP
jgi:hypothetical protein